MQTITGERLSGLKAIVTSSSRGIGKAIAMTFAEQGADLIINCDKSMEEAESVAGQIRALGRRSSVCIADVKDPADCERLVEYGFAEMGRIDILVNNAGIAKDSLLSNVKEDAWADVIATNLTGVLNCTKAVCPKMRAQRSGRIINISSVVGEMGNTGQSSYSASKAGVIGLTKTLAKELARDGILVNAIAPRFCNTPMVIGIPEEVREKILKTIPLKRFGEPKEIAHAAVFLAPSETSYITGQVIGVNGGIYG